MASYQELLDFYQQNVPGGNQGQGTPAYGDRFNKWTQEIMDDLGVSDWSQIPTDELANYEYVGPAPGASGAAEPTIFNAIAPGVAANIAGDAGRQKEVQDLTNQVTAGYGDLRSTLDLAKVKTDPTTGAITSGLLTSQNANADRVAADQKAAAATSAKAQLDALNKSIADAQVNLQGAAAQQAAALQQTITTLSTNLDTLDASQRKNLADQIGAQQQNLSQSIETQRGALAQEAQQLQGNASAAAQARRAALEQQIAGLTAAQAPLNAARLHAAEGLVTAVNLGLEDTKDQLSADAVRDGYVGGSTMQDAALARAVVGARQQGANIVGGARVANATDNRDIGRYGANAGYSIADALAGRTNDISDYATRTGAGLTVAGAEGSRTLADALASQNRTLGDTTATSRAQIGSFGALTGLDNQNKTIASDLNLKNALTSGTAGIATTQAQQDQDAANRAAAAKGAYSDQAYGAGVNAAQINAGLPAAEAATKTALIPYGNAGATNSLNLLNWFAAPATPPGSTAVTVAPPNTGNQIAGLGANMLGAAFQFPSAWGAVTDSKKRIPETSGYGPGYDANGRPIASGQNLPGG